MTYKLPTDEEKRNVLSLKFPQGFESNFALIVLILDFALYAIG